MKITGAVSKTTLTTTTTLASTAVPKVLPRVEPSTTSSPLLGTFGAVADPSQEKFFECDESAVPAAADVTKPPAHERDQDVKVKQSEDAVPFGDFLGPMAMDEEEDILAFFGEGLEDDFDPIFLP